MENRAYALVTGLFILLLGAAVIAAALWLGGGTGERSPYIVVSTGNVAGLVTHSTVMYRGVQVGQVESIGFDPDNFKRILVYIQVDADIPVTKGTYAMLRPQGVSGFSRIELSDDGKQPQRVHTSADNPATIPMHKSLLSQVATSGADLIAEGNRLLKNLNALVDGENGSKIQQILSNMAEASHELVALEKSLQPLLAQVPNLAEQSQSTLKRMNELLQQVGTLSSHIDDLTQAAQQLGKVGARAGQQISRSILPQASALLGSLNDAVDELQRLTRRLNEHPESLLRGAPSPPPGPGEPGYQSPGRR